MQAALACTKEPVQKRDKTVVTPSSVLTRARSHADTENWEAGTVTHTDGEGRSSGAETTPEQNCTSRDSYSPDDYAIVNFEGQGIDMYSYHCVLFLHCEYYCVSKLYMLPYYRRNGNYGAWTTCV